MVTNIICELIYSMEEITHKEMVECETEYDDLERLRREEVKIQNRGTGAGGSNTNKNGLTYEKQKDLSSEYEVVERMQICEKIRFKSSPNKTLITGKKSEFMKYLRSSESVDMPDIIRKGLHGTKQPDNWFISGNNIFIVELKFQQGGGSVCEKLQTPRDKIRHLEDRYPGKKIHYIYGLHEWFRENCEGEVYYLERDNITHFWGDDKDFKQNVINHIISNL